MKRSVNRLLHKMFSEDRLEDRQIVRACDFLLSISDQMEKYEILNIVGTAMRCLRYTHAYKEYERALTEK